MERVSEGKRVRGGGGMKGRTGKQVKSDYHYELKGLWVY